MNYISTRSGCGPDSPPIGFLDAVLAGLAPDGGLYVPQTWPAFTPEEIAAFGGKPYHQVAAAVLGRFAGDEIPADVLGDMCREAYDSFSHAATAPLKQLYPDTYLLELFHGPTLAFKDVAMQLLGRLYDYALKRQGRKITILAATSGDTGGAAVEAFRGRSNVNIVVLFPDGRISEVQRRFMTTATEANVRCVAVQGTFDDCQGILKAAFQDDQFRTAVDLSAVNSINFARIAAQCVYYFTAAVALGAPATSPAFVVPTGNFGDAFAGYVAHAMGLPISRILTATNSNDIVARAFTEGRYSRGVVAPTQSPAMDIQVASNFERLYFECARRDGLETGRAFQAFASTGGLDIPPAALAAMRDLFAGASVSETDTSAAMVSTLNETGELIDPHTAVAVAAARRLGSPSPYAPQIVLSTAHPAKFTEAVHAATGVIPPSPRGAGELAARPERFDRLPADGEAVKAYVRDFAIG
ncbi:threonine synthase [Caulobacter ginsengisoli]|uniref:Threonine synthase n=1 Tax=Caulobacter ginsengisoli TaxID=400775 RepID=A0ABU0IXC6_9CAUL|nr:threonine synthase [Caulobacter ginsengisoli]MDQ0466671.1 threonine synthase [Caulobacter ginsengisoli]